MLKIQVFMFYILCQQGEPQVESLEFDIDQEDVPPDIRHVLVDIKKVNSSTRR